MRVPHNNGAPGRFFFLFFFPQVKYALDLLDRYRDPLASARASRVSVAGLMVLTAEDIRDEGMPDWMQVRRPRADHALTDQETLLLSRSVACLFPLTLGLSQRY